MHSWDILGQVHDHESFLPRADPHLHWQGRGPLSGYSFFRVAPLSSCVCLVEIFNSRCTICMRQMLNPWTWWWSIFYEVTRLESHHALLSKFSFLQFLEVILFPIFSHHDQCHLQRILQEKQLMMELQRPSLTSSWGFVWDQRFDVGNTQWWTDWDKGLG